MSIIGMEGKVIDDKAQHRDAGDVDAQVIQAKDQVQFLDKSAQLLVSSSECFDAAHRVRLWDLCFQGLGQLYGKVLQV